jgi:integrase
LTVRGTKKKADKRLRELLHQLDTGLPIDNSKVTVKEYLGRWLSDVVALRNRQRTLDGYSTIVHRHIIPAIGGTQLVKLQPADVQKMESRLLDSGLGANTVHHVHIALVKALKDAMRQGLIHRNVCQAVEPPSPGRYEVTVPDAQAIREVLELAMDTPYGPVMHFIAYTGVRRGEAVALKWANVDLERAIVSITQTAQRFKGKGIVFEPTKSAAGRRGITLDSGTVDMLRAHRGAQLLLAAELGGALDDMGLVFPSPFGGPVDPSVITRNFEKLARKAGCLGLRLHDLRHGHAAGLIRAGMHPKVVQDRLGHASAAFTMQVYGHIAADLQAEAANAFADFMAEKSGQQK